MTTAAEFINRQLGTAGWVPLDEAMAKRLCPDLHQPHIDIAAYRRNPEQLPRLFPGALLYQANVDNCGRVLILSRSPQFLAERIDWLGFRAVEVAPFREEGARQTPKAMPTTSDLIAVLHAGIETREPPRPCKVCGNLGGGVACLAAARGELEGVPRDYLPDTQWPRRCLSYAPPRADRDEILGRDGRKGRQLWPEVAAVADLQVDGASTAGKAVALLANLLKDGPRDAAEILATAEGASISERSVQRAADSLGVAKTKAGFGEGWVWALPAEQAA